MPLELRSSLDGKPMAAATEHVLRQAILFHCGGFDPCPQLALPTRAPEARPGEDIMEMIRCLPTTTFDSRRKSVFHIPFAPIPPSAAFADRAGLEDWLRRWFTGFGIASVDWQIVEKWKIPRFVQLTAPMSRTRDGVRLACAWTAWLHCFDDVFDAPTLSRDPVAVRAMVAQYLDYISAQRANEDVPEADGDGLWRAFLMLDRWTVAPMSLRWRSQWYDDLSEYVGAYVMEARHRASGTILPADELLGFKRICMAQRTAMHLMERTTTDELSPLAKSLVLPAVDIVADITGALNDTVSLARERARGDVHNLMLSMCHHHSMTEHEAREWIVRFVSRRCRDLADAMLLNASDPRIQGERETVTRWMLGCGQFVRGYHDWMLETGRYAGEAL